MVKYFWEVVMKKQMTTEDANLRVERNSNLSAENEILTARNERLEAAIREAVDSFYKLGISRKDLDGIISDLESVLDEKG